MFDGKIFSENLKKARKSKNISQKDLADLTGLTPSTISSYEQKGTTPTADKLCLLADVLDVSVDYLVGNEKANKSNPLEFIKEFLLLSNAEFSFVPTNTFDEYSATVDISDTGILYYIQQFQKVLTVLKGVSDKEMRNKVGELLINDFDKTYTDKMEFINGKLRFKDDPQNGFIIDNDGQISPFIISDDDLVPF